MWRKCQVSVVIRFELNKKKNNTKSILPIGFVENFRFP